MWYYWAVSIAWLSTGAFCYMVSTVIGWDRIFRSPSLYPKDSNSVQRKCIRCNRYLHQEWLSLLIDTSVQCSACGLKVCKSCAEWNPTRNTFNCGHCHPPKALPWKNFWIGNSSVPINSLTNNNPEPTDKALQQVRDQLEYLIETSVDPHINSVCVSKLYDNPLYDYIFRRFHGELSDAFMSVSESYNAAFESNIGDLPVEETRRLTELLIQVRKTALGLPAMTMTAIQIPDINSLPATDDNMAYEDMLATAVLNKVVLEGQTKVEIDVSVADSAVQTDGEVSTDQSESSESHSRYKDVRGWVTNVDKYSLPNLSDSDLSMGASSSNWSGDGKGQQIVIEEQVEEILTTYDDDDTDSDSALPPSRESHHKTSSDSSWNKKRMSGDEAFELLGGEFIGDTERVPFPESGLDIVIATNGNESTSIHEISQQISAWEQNWLFKHRKRLFRSLLPESVPMLVPNPINEADLIPQIGDEKASDMSDLSDNAAGEDSDDQFLSSSEESEIEEPSTITPKEIKVTPTSGHTKDSSNVSRENAKNTPKLQFATKEMQNNSNDQPKNVIRFPEDATVMNGESAQFTCVVEDEAEIPDNNVTWFFSGKLLSIGDSVIMDQSKGKYTLTIPRVREASAGQYTVKAFDTKGKEYSHTFKLKVQSPFPKGRPPNFTLIKENVIVPSNVCVFTVPFEVEGNPEPDLQILKNDQRISTVFKDSPGRWSMTLVCTEEAPSMSGEYVAKASNSMGTTRVTFRVVQESSSAFNEEDETSSIEETPRDLSHSTASNQTVLKEDLMFEDPESTQFNKGMTIAEREKMKWANPVSLSNNPYAPENLAKRIRKQNSIGSFQNLQMSKSASSDLTTSEDEKEDNPITISMKPNYQKFARDYYVPTVSHNTDKGHGVDTSKRITVTAPLSNTNTKSPPCSSVSQVQLQSGLEKKPDDISVQASSCSKERGITAMSPVRKDSTESDNTGRMKSQEKKGSPQPGPMTVPSIIKPPEETNTKEKLQRTNSAHNPLKQMNSPKIPTAKTTPTKELQRSKSIGQMDPDPISLPSVKRLAEKFSIASPDPEGPNTNTKPMSKIHSLTARSVSREFREGLRLSQPAPPNMNIKIGAGCGSLQGNGEEDPHPAIITTIPESNHFYSPKCNKKQLDSNSNKLKSKNILSRAAFWDKRVQESIVHDHLVIHEFPEMK